MTIPTGNGEVKGNEAAGDSGSPLSSRPQRAAANDAKTADFIGCGDPKDQAGFGMEDMQHTAAYLSQPNIPPSVTIAPVPDLMSMGNPGEAFGGS